MDLQAAEGVVGEHDDGVEEAHVTGPNVYRFCQVSCKKDGSSVRCCARINWGL